MSPNAFLPVASGLTAVLMVMIVAVSVGVA